MLPESVEEASHQTLERDEQEEDHESPDARDIQIPPHDAHHDSRLDRRNHNVNQNVTQLIETVEVIGQDVEHLSNTRIIK